MTITYSEQNGILISYTTAPGRDGPLVGTIQKDLLLQSPLADVTRNLLDGVASFGAAVSNIVATYNPELQNGKIRDVAANMLPRTFQAVMRAGRAEARRIEMRWAELMVVPMLPAFRQRCCGRKIASASPQ